MLVVTESMKWWTGGTPWPHTDRPINTSASRGENISFFSWKYFIFGDSCTGTRILATGGQLHQRGRVLAPFTSVMVSDREPWVNYQEYINISRSIKIYWSWWKIFQDLKEYFAPQVRQGWARTVSHGRRAGKEESMWSVNIASSQVVEILKLVSFGVDTVKNLW